MRWRIKVRWLGMSLFIQQNFPAHKKWENMFRISQPIHIFCMWMMKLLAGRKHFIADAPGGKKESFGKLWLTQNPLNFFWSLFMGFLLALVHRGCQPLSLFPLLLPRMTHRKIYIPFIIFNQVCTVHNIFMVPHCTHLHHI